MKVKLEKAVLAGLAGTAAMTALMLMAPMMGMPPMNIGAMLGSAMGGNVVLGWMAHFMIGAALALGYAALFAERLPGAPFVRGSLFSLCHFLPYREVVGGRAASDLGAEGIQPTLEPAGEEGTSRCVNQSRLADPLP